MFKKSVSILTMLLMSALLFGACMLPLASDKSGGREKNPNPELTSDANKPGDKAGTDGLWTNDNAVFVSIKTSLTDFIADVPKALGIKAHHILEKYDGRVSQVLLVLNESGNAAQASAAAVLTALPSVAYARPYQSVPFETENTLRLVASGGPLEAGYEISVKPEGGLRVYEQSFSFDEIIVTPANQNLHKEFTPADFLQVVATKVELAYVLSGVASYTLTLAEPGYFNVIKAVDVLARAPDILSAYLNGWGFPDVYCSDRWEISDTSVADFAKLPSADGSVTVKGLKAGKVTVTYIPSLGWRMGTDYAVTLELPVADYTRGVIEGADGADYRINSDALIYTHFLGGTSAGPAPGVIYIPSRSTLLSMYEASKRAFETPSLPGYIRDEAKRAAAFAALDKTEQYYSEEFFATRMLMIIGFETPYASIDYRLHKVSYTREYSYEKKNWELVLEYQPFFSENSGLGQVSVDPIIGYGAVAVDFPRMSFGPRVIFGESERITARGNVVIGLPPETREKEICKATINDDFAPDTINVGLNRLATYALSSDPAAPGLKMYTPADFPEIECVAVSELTVFTTAKANEYLASIAPKDYTWDDIKKAYSGMAVNIENNRRMFSLTLKNPGKANVLAAIKELEKRGDILFAEPNYYMYLD
ncbi:MAG: Ig-like domain-containing protein [Firmicutes bacterium]|nr:Ig-like domain-containing protein [Bacillota bacterium]